ncbi:hypothetical protein, variant 1 [Phytophthora nicotianae P1569]|nr:hypothetical protein, variant 1 [Phytophthora nicotianae P1569]ETO84420.1 hypothetical protein F444_01665 [Phytophthora nicotianae P1976]
MYSLRTLRSTTQDDSSVEAPWIEGVRQSTDQHQRSITFMLNGEPYDKWYYHWESSSHKMQRAAKHVLRAYVLYQFPSRSTDFERTQSAQQSSQLPDDKLDLLCFVDSPPFTLVSYRRSTTGDSIEPRGNCSRLQQMCDNATATTSQLKTRAVHSEPCQQIQVYDSRTSHERRGQLHQTVDSYETPTLPQSQVDHSRYRQFLEREELDCWLMTQGDAALSEPVLHSHIQSQERRLVFHRKRQKQGLQHLDVCETTPEENKKNSAGSAQESELINDTRIATHQERNDTDRTGYVENSPASLSFRQSDENVCRAVQPFVSNQRQSDRHEYQLQLLTDLAVIHCFVSHFTASFPVEVVNLEMKWAEAISKHWNVEAVESIHLARLLETLFQSQATNRTPNFKGSTHRRLDEILPLLAEICVWTFSPTNFKFIRTLLTECYPLFARFINGHSGNDDTGNMFRTTFLNCVEKIWISLDDFLRTQISTKTTARGVRGLSDAILSVVYTNPVLEELRPVLEAVLNGSTSWLDNEMNSHRSGVPLCSIVGWRGFVAQVREGYLRQQCSTHGFPVQHLDARSRWAGEWLLRPSTVEFTLHTDENLCTKIPRRDSTSTVSAAGYQPSMWTSCLALSQLLHLRLAVMGSPLDTAFIQAEPSLLSPNNSWLQLICDGRARVAPVAPSGLSSLLAGPSYTFGGDYIARYVSKEDRSIRCSSRNMAGDTGVGGVIFLEFYWWPLEDTKTSLVAYRMVVTLMTTARVPVLNGSVRFERGLIDQDTVTSAATPHLELWVPTERVQLVKTWKQWLIVDGQYRRT